MRVTRSRGLVAVLAATLLVFGVAATAVATDGVLPGGTSISVAIDDPADGDVFLIPEGDTALAIDVHGTASVGEGTPVKNTTVVYVIDVSGSTGGSAGVDCDGNPGFDSILTCEKVGVSAANSAAAAPQSSVLNSGVGTFASSGSTLDVDPAAGIQLLTAPGVNIDNAIAPLTDGGGTLFSAGVAAGNTILSDTAAASVKILIFLSDGFSGGSLVGATLPAGTIVKAFAIGSPSNVSCTGNPYGPDLAEVAALGAAGSDCQQVTDPSDLADVITESIGSTLDSLYLAVDGGAATMIGNADIDPDLPQDGPANVDYWTMTAPLGAGDHEICVTANGTDAGGSGSVEHCVTITLVQEVAIDIKPGSFPNSINVNKKKGVTPVAILGSDTFDVTTIDVTTLEFAGAAPRHDLTDGDVYADHLQDVNGDGYVDLVSHYLTPMTNIVPGDTEACISGAFNGATFHGCDSVRTIPAS